MAIFQKIDYLSIKNVDAANANAIANANTVANANTNAGIRKNLSSHSFALIDWLSGKVQMSGDIELSGAFETLEL
jgi:hypothetical protein